MVAIGWCARSRAHHTCSSPTHGAPAARLVVCSDSFVANVLCVLLRLLRSASALSCKPSSRDDSSAQPPIVEFSRALCLNSRKLPDAQPTQLFVPRRLFESFARGLWRWIARFAGNARLRSLSENESAERLFHSIRGNPQVGSQSVITKSPWILSRQQAIATQRTTQRWCDAGACQSHQQKACLSMLTCINVRLHARLTEIGLFNMTVK